MAIHIVGGLSPRALAPIIKWGAIGCALLIGGTGFVAGLIVMTTPRYVRDFMTPNGLDGPVTRVMMTICAFAGVYIPLFCIGMMPLYAAATHYDNVTNIPLAVIIVAINVAGIIVGLIYGAEHNKKESQ